MIIIINEKNHLNILEEYTFVLKNVQFLASDNHVISSKYFKKNGLAELREYRIAKVSTPENLLEIRYSDSSFFSIYLTDNSGEFVNNIVSQNISAYFDNKISIPINDIEVKIIPHLDGILVRFSKLYDIIKTYSFNNDSHFFILTLPYNDGKLLKITFQYEKVKVFSYKTTIPYEQDLSTRILMWWYGVNLDTTKIRQGELY